MLGALLYLGLATSNYTLTTIDNDTNHYHVRYEIPITEDLLTNGGEFDLYNYTNLNLNDLEFRLGRVVIEANSSTSDVYTSETINISGGLYSDSLTTHIISYDWSYLQFLIGFNINVDNVNIENYIGETITYNFNMYVDSADTFLKQGTYDLSLTASNIDNSLFDSGYSTGYDVGYDVGFNEGVNADSTLLTLIKAVPDAFISSFITIFSFEIFGVNVSGFIISVISISVFIWVLRKVLGK